MTDQVEVNSIELAAELTIAWLQNPNNRVDQEDVPGFLARMHQTLANLGSPEETAEPSNGEGQFTPAVSVRKSLASKDHIISMIDGKAYKTLKRHLANHGLTPEEYRARYGLKPDYPMVAPNYAAMRRDMAIKIGLGAKAGTRRGKRGAAAPAAAAPAPAPAPTRKRASKGE